MKNKRKFILMLNVFILLSIFAFLFPNDAKADYPAVSNVQYNGDAISLALKKPGIPEIPYSPWPQGVQVVGTSRQGCEAFSQGWTGPYYFRGGASVAQINDNVRHPGLWITLCGSIAGYSCPNGGYLSGTTCIVSNGCEANTCIGETCNNGSNPTAPGSKNCGNLTVKGRCGAATGTVYNQSTQPPAGDLCLPVFYGNFPLRTDRFTAPAWDGTVWKWSCLSSLGFPDQPCRSKTPVVPKSGECGNLSTGIIKSTTTLGPVPWFQQIMPNCISANATSWLSGGNCSFMYPTMFPGFCEVGSNYINEWERMRDIYGGLSGTYTCAGVNGGPSVQCRMQYAQCGNGTGLNVYPKALSEAPTSLSSAVELPMPFGPDGSKNTESGRFCSYGMTNGNTYIISQLGMSLNKTCAYDQTYKNEYPTFFSTHSNYTSNNKSAFLCAPGEASAVTIDGDKLKWTCTGADNKVDCSANYFADMPVKKYDLNVSVSSHNYVSPAFGEVVSIPSGIDCRPNNSGTCKGKFDSGSTVQLIIPENVASKFIGWEGGVCSGNGLTCNVLIDSVKNVTARFINNCAVDTCDDQTCFNGFENVKGIKLGCPKAYISACKPNIQNGSSTTLTWTADPALFTSCYSRSAITEVDPISGAFVKTWWGPITGKDGGWFNSWTPTSPLVSRATGFDQTFTTAPLSFEPNNGNITYQLYCNKIDGGLSIASTKVNVGSGFNYEAKCGIEGSCGVDGRTEFDENGDIINKHFSTTTPPKELCSIGSPIFQTSEGIAVIPELKDSVWKYKCNTATSKPDINATDYCVFPFFTGSGWLWQCTGIFGGQNSTTCIANTDVTANAECGPGIAKNSSSRPDTEPASNLCNPGTFVGNNIDGAGSTWKWKCDGLNGGKSVDCEKNKKNSKDFGQWKEVAPK
jgi:hypothetical protein